jgi:RNA polymerase sigma-70 factor (ECF subfamily)
MNLDQSRFEGLMQRLREGSAEAARELLDSCADSVLWVIRRRLNPRLRSKFDSWDFQQDVWASFFRRAAQAQQFHQPAQLLAFLRAIARHKVASANRRWLDEAKHDVRREVSIQRLAAEQGGIFAADPDPEAAACVHEEWARLIAGLPVRARTALDLLRQGYSQREVAARLGVNPRTVRRLVEHLKQRL